MNEFLKQKLNENMGKKRKKIEGGIARERSRECERKKEKSMSINTIN